MKGSGDDGTAPMPGTALLWLGRDLRLADHPALLAAARHERLLVCYVHAPAEEAPWALGAAAEWWLHHALASLAAALAAKGSRLLVRHGPTLETLAPLVKQHDVRQVYRTQRFEPAVRARDDRVAQALAARGVPVQLIAGTTLASPSRIETRAGGVYRVYGAFWTALVERPVPQPLPAPRQLPPPPPDLGASDALALLTRLSWADAFPTSWRPGEDAALAALATFGEDRVATYEALRNVPSVPGTSRLSPALAHGEISVRTIWHALKARAGAVTYLKELAWREFAFYLLWHFPEAPLAPLRPEFAAFPWRASKSLLTAWQRGATGYPIVDAGMRELWTTGWMHNRVRMIVASFLTKHLRLPWQDGARWFWDTLVDADLASNTLGWQWTSGVGVDAAPYFRIFNPTLQGERFDADGTYVKRWVPELAALAPRYLHAPWAAPEAVLAAAGVRLGKTYPRPIVDHTTARREALEAFASLKAEKAAPLAAKTAKTARPQKTDAPRSR